MRFPDFENGISTTEPNPKILRADVKGTEKTQRECASEDDQGCNAASNWDSIRIQETSRQVSSKDEDDFRRKDRCLLIRIEVRAQFSRVEVGYFFSVLKAHYFCVFPSKMRQCVGCICMCHKGDHRPSDLHSTALNFCPLPISRIELSKLSKSSKQLRSFK